MAEVEGRGRQTAPQVASATVYRLRATFRRRRAGLLAIVLLTGIVGGISMAAVSAARRTQSSYPKFLASTNPSDLSVIDDPSAYRTIEHLPNVLRGSSVVVLNAVPLGANGAPERQRAAAANVFTLGSIDGLLFDQDRVTVVAGRMADRTRPDEGVVTSEAARDLGLHLDDRVRLGFSNDRQKLTKRFNVKIVGIVVMNDAVVQDDAERSLTYVVLTPALTKSVKTCCAQPIAFTGLQLVRGARDDARVAREYESQLPADASFYLREASVPEAKAERALKPESIALGVFGAIAGIAALLIVAQVIGRQFRADIHDRGVLRALGASPALSIADGLVGVVGATVTGALLAALLAVATSPLSPIGPVRAVYPTRGIAFDWTVLAAGTAGLTFVLSAFAIVVAVLGAPHRLATRAHHRTPRRSMSARAAVAAGLSVSGATGVRFAFGSTNRNRDPTIRSATFGATMAIVVVAATLTFGASLHSLVSHPRLYGWNWNYELETVEGGESISARSANALLGRDPAVKSWTGFYFDSLRIDALTVPVLATTPRPAVQPPLLSGHGFDAGDEIVLGPTTLAELGKRVGDTVEAGYATQQARSRLRIVGTATMPAVGPALGLHVSMGTGALVPQMLLPRDSLATGPNALFVRLRPGVDPSSALPKLREIASSLSAPSTAGSAFATTVSVLGAQRPAEIVNYRTMGGTPFALGAALALSAIGALALTLVASVRRRRRELALLKTLGFTRRQLASVVAWQSTSAAVIGILIGMPLGILAGRSLWDVFAQEIDAVPHATVPIVALTVVAAAAVALANLVAALPGINAARTPTAVLLRSE